MPLLISPVLDTAYKLRNKIDCVNLSQVMSNDCGAWQLITYANAPTSILHTESDCTYTLIGIPFHKLKRSKKSKRDSVFIFQLNYDQKIPLPLQRGLLFVFSGLFLIHYQNYPKHLDKNGGLFYNVVSYGNKKLFSQLHCLFMRNTDK